MCYGDCGSRYRPQTMLMSQLKVLQSKYAQPNVSQKHIAANASRNQEPRVRKATRSIRYQVEMSSKAAHRYGGVRTMFRPLSTCMRFVIARWALGRASRPLVPHGPSIDDRDMVRARRPPALPAPPPVRGATMRRQLPQHRPLPPPGTGRRIAPRAPRGTRRGLRFVAAGSRLRVRPYSAEWAGVEPPRLARYEAADPTWAQRAGFRSRRRRNEGHS